MRLTALVTSPDHISYRYRLCAFRPFLERAGYILEVRELPSSWWGQLRLAAQVRGASIIVQRKLLPIWQLRLLRRSVRHLLFDFDDAVWLRSSHKLCKPASCSRQRRFVAMMRHADRIIAGNDFLSTNALRHASPERVTVIPTCIDPKRYPLAEHKRNGQVQLVWIGTSSTLRRLERMAPLLEELGQKCPGLALKIVCDRFPSLQRLRVIQSPWSEAEEASALAEADIGISWLPDDLWSRGKCGLKILQYLAAGLPVVANPVGMHKELVRHGDNGFLAASPQEWIEAVRRLADNPELRSRMGLSGRRRAELEFSVALGGNRWLSLLERLQESAAQAG